MASTIYYLLVPLALFKIFQRKLTSIDLELDQDLKKIYNLGKLLYSTFSRDKELAKCLQEIPYEIHNQGLFVGHLDNMVEALIDDCENDFSGSSLQIKSFGKFCKKYMIYENNEVRFHGPFVHAYRLFYMFHPKTRPVLWRILVVQLFLYNEIQDAYAMKNNRRDLLLHTDKEKKRYSDSLKEADQYWNWLKNVVGVTDEKIVYQPFGVAMEFLKKYNIKVDKSKLPKEDSPDCFFNI